MKPMKKLCFLLLTIVVSGAIYSSCKKSAQHQAQDVNQARIQSIKAMGFDVSDIKKVEGGYLVEGDIMMTDDFVQNNSGRRLELCRVASLVCTSTTCPRVIPIRCSPGIPASIVMATDMAIARYNGLNLRIRFVRVASGGSILITVVSGLPTPAVSGFPSGCNPYNTVQCNNNIAGWNINTLATILTHELGHCIGMRHSDWFNRALSCGGAANSETPVPAACNGCNNADIPNSYMSACIPNGVNRNFTACDTAGLRSFYPICIP